jgi:hypothetical protein
VTRGRKTNRITAGCYPLTQSITTGRHRIMEKKNARNPEDVVAATAGVTGRAGVLGRKGNGTMAIENMRRQHGMHGEEWDIELPWMYQPAAGVGERGCYPFRQGRRLGCNHDRPRWAALNSHPAPSPSRARVRCSFFARLPVRAQCCKLLHSTQAGYCLVVAGLASVCACTRALSPPLSRQSYYYAHVFLFTILFDYSPPFAARVRTHPQSAQPEAYQRSK